MVQRRLGCGRHSFREARVVLGGRARRTWKRDRAADRVASPVWRGRLTASVDAAVRECVPDKPGGSQQSVAACLGLPEAEVCGAPERHDRSRVHPRLRFAGLDPMPFR